MTVNSTVVDDGERMRRLGVLLNIFGCFSSREGRWWTEELGITGLVRCNRKRSETFAQANKFRQLWNVLHGTVSQGSCEIQPMQPTKSYLRPGGGFSVTTWAPVQHSLPVISPSPCCILFAFFACSHSYFTFLEFQNLNMNCRAPVPPRSGFFILFRLPIDN